MLVGQENVALALSLDMVVVAGLVMAVYLPLQRRSARWLPDPDRGPVPRVGVRRSLGAASAGLYFLVPLAAVRGLHGRRAGPGRHLRAYSRIVSADGFVASLLLSLELAVATIVVVLLLTGARAMVALRLGAPRLRPVVEVVCSLPLVVPADRASSPASATVLKWGPDHFAHPAVPDLRGRSRTRTSRWCCVLAYV